MVDKKASIQFKKKKKKKRLWNVVVIVVSEEQQKQTLLAVAGSPVGQSICGLTLLLSFHHNFNINNIFIRICTSLYKTFNIKKFLF